ncbi:MAG: hypothetical protein H0X04_07495 [Chthoniobacterales bacterium]|nr:hypothetical protein [Chthoniobacterales bacterium]
MLDQIRQAVRKVPFEPFWIELSSGYLIPVPHPDHILVGKTRVAVEDDNGVIDVTSALHMTRIRWREREQSA